MLLRHWIVPSARNGIAPSARKATLPAALIALCLCLCLIPAAQAKPGPLRAVAEYVTRPACGAPARGRASCLAVLVTPRRGAGVAPSLAKPVLPRELHAAYGLPNEAAEPQTIMLVDAFDDPHAAADLGVYDSELELPECTEANGCFTKINQQGQSAPLPQANGEWSTEISADIEVAHSVCMNCRIVLVEAKTPNYGDLEAAEDAAAARIQATSKPGALEGEISNSWGGPEAGADSSAFNHPGIAITAAAGDNGYLNWLNHGKSEEEGYFAGADYPASSPHVVAVGGTRLTVGTQGQWVSEEVWNKGKGAGGGGCGKYPAPAWQPLALGWSAVGCGSSRAVADVAADADPATGVAVYDSVPQGLNTPEEVPGEEPPGWIQVGGTSVASPIVAAAFALAGGAHGVPYPAATLYAHAGSAALHDVTVGGNGECDDKYTLCSGAPLSPLDCGATLTICNAAVGYDGPTGVGTLVGLEAFQPVPGEVGGPGTGNGGGSGPPAGGGGGTASPGNAPTPPPTPPSSSPPPAAKSPAGPPRVSRLALTLSAVAALNRGRPRASALAFSFSLNVAARVRVTLAKWVRVRHRWRWVSLPVAFTLGARGGANVGRLGTGRHLAAGRYRLTLAPAQGIAGSLLVVIG